MTQKFKLGVLVTGPMIPELRETHGEYDDIFARFFVDNADEDSDAGNNSWQLKPYRVLENIFPQSVNDADGWLITGSRYGVYEAHDWIKPLEEFIRKAQQENVPMVGICFGHQIMAQALGGAVEKYKDGWIVGDQTYRTKHNDFHILAWHQDQVIVKPAQAEIIAHNDNCLYAGLLYGDWGLSLQAHPEFTPAFFNDLLSLRGDKLLPKELLAHIHSYKPAPPDSPHIAQVIKRFLQNRICEF